MRDAFAVGLDIQLDLLVFLDDVFFDVLYVNARILHRNRAISAGDFDGQTNGVGSWRSSRFGWRSGILSANRKSDSRRKNGSDKKISQFGPKKTHDSADSLPIRKP